MTEMKHMQVQDLQRGARQRRRNETLLAYFLIAPAAICTFTFGLYPVILGLWQSLKTGRVVANDYTGLDNLYKRLR